MSIIEQLRKEWISEAKKRGLFMDDLISRKAVHDNIGEMELFAYLTDDDIREHGLYVDEDGEFYFTEEQGRMASVMYILMRRYIEKFPAVDITEEVEKETTARDSMEQNTTRRSKEYHFTMKDAGERIFQCWLLPEELSVVLARKKYILSSFEILGNETFSPQMELDARFIKDIWEA